MTASQLKEIVNKHVGYANEEIYDAIDALNNSGGFYCYDVFNNAAGSEGNLRIHVASFKNEEDAIKFASGEPHLSIEIGHYIYTGKKN